MTGTTTGKRYYALAADNHREAREVMADRLEALGFEVVRARDPDEADALLRSRYFHLALIDLRLRDDTDSDNSGMQVVRDNDLPTIRIITSNFTTQQAQDNYIHQLATAQISPVVVFVPKDESHLPDDRRLPAVVRALMARHLSINETAHLTDEHGRGYNTRDLLDSLHPERLPEHVDEHLRELDDILRMVFYDAQHLADAQPIQQVTLRGLEARGWLLAQTFDHHQQTSLYLIGIGTHEAMAAEQSRAVISPAFRALLADEDSRRTVHYRANSYRYVPPGGRLEGFVPLVEAIRHAEDADTLHGWIRALNFDFQPQGIAPEVCQTPLSEAHDDHDARLRAALGFLQRARVGWRVSDDYLLAGDSARTLLNPVGRVNDLLRQPVKHLRRRVHGQMAGRTLVDQHNSQLLTYDYTSLRVDHALTDLIGVLHECQLACLGDLPLSARVALIEAWQNRQPLGEENRLSVVSDALGARADYLLIEEGGMTSDEASRFIALACLLDAVQALSRYNLDLPAPPAAMAGEVGHRVAVAAVMTAWLSGVADLPPAEVFTRAWVVHHADNAGTLWVQGTPYALRGNDYLLLRALLSQPGELMTYSQLTQARYESSGDPHSEREATQQAIKRLRDRLSELGLWGVAIMIDTVDRQGYRARVLID